MKQPKMLAFCAVLVVFFLGHAAHLAQAGDLVSGDRLSSGSYTTNPDGSIPGEIPAAFTVDPVSGILHCRGAMFFWNPQADRYETTIGNQVFWWLFDAQDNGPLPDSYLYGRENADGSNMQIIGQGNLIKV